MLGGENDYGQVGNGTREKQLSPVKVLSNVETVFLDGMSGEVHSAAITVNGDLYCWGWNKRGQVGNGTRKDQLRPIKVLSNVKTFSLNYHNSAAITANGDLYCWGENDYGQVGNGTREDQLSPIKVLSNVETFSLGYGQSTAVTTSGDLYCWGRNEHGEVGNETTENQLNPVKVLSNVEIISVDYYNRAAITTNGDLYCWGWNEHGEVGNGTQFEDQLSPVKVLSNVEMISLGSNNGAAITTNGDLYCWGQNDSGGVGNGTREDQLSPIKVLSNVETILMSNDHKAAITTNKDLYCWGWNNHGEVGNGTIRTQLSPVKVLSNVETFSLGYGQSTAVTTSGDLYCWGYDYCGQTGDYRSPAKVLSDVETFLLNGSHNAAITTDGDLYCWGNNYYGQVGNGTREDQLTPVKIFGKSNTFKVFNKYLYRANHLTDTSIPSQMTYIKNTPSEIMVRELQKNGGANLITAWNILTKTCDAALDPSKLVDYMFEEKDIYNAIILNILESASKYDVIDTINADILKDTNELLQLIKSNLKLEYSLEIYENTKNSTFTKDMRLRTMELAGEYFDKKKVPKAVGWLNKFENVMDYLDTVEGFVEEVVSYVNIRSLNDSIKTVLKEMKNNCPSNNKAFSDALSECMNIIEASDNEFAEQMINGAFEAVGKEVVKSCISKYWDECIMSELQIKYPNAAIIIVAYKASKYLTNIVFNTDETAEKYYKMIAATQVNEVTRKTYESLEKKYLKNQTVDNAKAYLSSIDILSNAVIYDCGCAYEYVDCVDSAAINKICNFFNCGSDYGSVKLAIDRFESGMYSEHERILTSWVNYLPEDFPEEYDKYKKILDESLQRVKEYKVHCPVDVYVYDSKNTLVASVINNIPSTSGISVVVENDEKTFYLPEGEEYSFTYIGNDTGVMDIEILERDTNDTILRNTTFNNIVLSKGETYNSDENGKFMESAQYAIVSSNNEKKEADFDSYTKDKKPTHTISIEQGTIFSNGVPSYTLDACENEMLDISAYIPIGYELDTWKVLSGNIQIKDINNVNTKIIVGNQNATIKAVLKKVRFKYGDVNSDGEVNIQDGVILKKYLADIKGLNINMDASDVNGDGRVNISDAVILMKHLAGMSVNLGKAVNK